MAKIISGRVKKTPQSGLTSDRYQFLGLEQAEPDLGDPIVGPSSTKAKPYPAGDQYVLLTVGGRTGERYWIKSTDLVPPGLTPGSFTIYDNNQQIGIANSFNIFNFVGNAVSVDPVGPNFEDQTGIATVRIEVIDVYAPGNPYEIPYHDPISGYLRGATGVVYFDGNIGIGSTEPIQKLDVLGSANISESIYSNNAYLTEINVGSLSTTLKTSNSNVGIGSTLPKYKLDIFGESRFYGLVRDYLESSGESGNVLLSNGPTSPPTWGVAGSIVPVSKARYVETKEATNNQLYYIGFSSNTSNFSSLYVDSNGLYYNPASVSLGIGTQPKYALDVSGTIKADQIISENISEAPGIVTTTSTQEQVIDSFNSSQYRSARYNIQVTTNNQLQLGTGSVSGINSGLNYTSGVYENVPLVSSGIGTGAKATISVVAPIYPITSSFGGIFTTSNSISGIETGYNVIFDRELSPSDYEQSKLTSISVSNSGAGYTTIPNITIYSPIIVGNPVSGVGIGSTALTTRVSMKVTNTVLNTIGIVTNLVPTATYDSPIGTGVTAIGYVGFGISTFTVTGVGTNYTSSPSISYGQTPTVLPVTRVGLGISDANILITPGSGYNTGVTTITVVPVGGIGTGASIILGSVNGSGGITDIDITNVGSGYTVPPLVTITNSGSGVGAAITITKMIVTNIDVISPGSGFGTSKPAITFIGGGGSGAAATVSNILLTSIKVTNSGYGYTSADMPVDITISTPGVGATVGLGIYSIEATTGLGYTIAPGFTISNPEILPNVGASLTSFIGYGTQFNLLPGPGYGGTSIYYIDPINSNSFRITKTLSGFDYITLGYDLSAPLNSYIGGGNVESVIITNNGSGYQIGEQLTIHNSDLNLPFDQNIGQDFSFIVSGNLIQSFQTSDLMVLHSVGSASTNAYLVEYAGISNLENLGNYSTSIVGENVQLKFTPTYAHNVVKFNRKGTEL